MDLDPNLIYIGVRPTSNFTLGPVGTSQSMTTRIFQKIKSNEGATFQFSFWSAQQINPSNGHHEFYEFSAFEGSLLKTLEYPTNIEAIRAAQHLPLNKSDGVFGLNFMLPEKEEALRLYERRDPDISGETAQRNFSAHWGMENWGGLFLLLSLEGEKVFQSAIDVFTCDDDAILSDKIHILAYSQDPSLPTDKQITGSEQDSAENAKNIKHLPRPNLIDPKKIGKCIKCGEVLEVEYILLETMNRESDSYLMHSCGSCGEKFTIKVLSKYEENRKGYKYEAVFSL